MTSEVSTQTHTVKIGTGEGLLEFDPESITAAPGDTIEWVNNRMGPHNVVFEATHVPGLNKSLASSLSCTSLMTASGQTKTTQIPLDAPPGEYRFHCAIHRGAGEKGMLIVEMRD